MYACKRACMYMAMYMTSALHKSRYRYYLL